MKQNIPLCCPASCCPHFMLVINYLSHTNCNSLKAIVLLWQDINAFVAWGFTESAKLITITLTQISLYLLVNPNYPKENNVLNRNISLSNHCRKQNALVHFGIVVCVGPVHFTDVKCLYWYWDRFCNKKVPWLVDSTQINQRVLLHLFWIAPSISSICRDSFMTHDREPWPINSHIR